MLAMTTVYLLAMLLLTVKGKILISRVFINSLTGGWELESDQSNNPHLK